MSPQYSQSSWRHGPQGGVGAAVSATTAISANSRAPSESALSSATRSAQTVSAYVAFSTLQPVKIFPSLVRSAAPTLKFEYGAEAFVRASRAAATSRSESLNDPLQECDELLTHASGRFDHFLCRDRLRQDARGHIGNAG